MQPRGEKRDRAYRYDRHLNTALTFNKILFYKTFPDARERDYPEIPQVAFEDLRSGFCRNQNVLHKVQTMIVSHAHLIHKESRDTFHRCLKLASASLSIQSQALYETMEGFQKTSFNTMAKLAEKDPMVNQSVVWKAHVLKIHSEVSLKSSKGDWLFELENLPGFIFYGPFVVVKDYCGSPLVLTYEMFLGVLDKIEASFHFWFYVASVEATPKFNGGGYGLLARQLHKELEDAHIQLGVKANKLYKVLEALCTGAILETQDERTNDVGFLIRTLDELNESDHDVYNYALRVVELFRTRLEGDPDRYVPLILDCYGQEKLHFFPLVDGEMGLLKMYRYGTSYRSSEFSVDEVLRGLLMREFTLSYYSKEKKLPDIHMLSSYDPRLIKMWKSGVCHSAKFCRVIPLKCWGELICNKMFDFDYTADPLDMVEDKACSPDRSNLNQIYHPSVRQAYKLSSPTGKSIRRLVQWVLKQQDIDIKELFNQAESIGQIPWEWTLVLLTLKERENKPDGRPFSTLHPKLRMMTSSLEKNISQTIYKYFPQQTLTSSGSEVMSSVDLLASKKSGTDYAQIKFHLDLEQWNYTFRERVTIGCQRWLNEVFGVSHYFLLMNPFKDALFVLNDSYCPYADTTQFNMWTDHAGGNQGICQKFWTLMTILTINLAITPTGWDYILIGSGDNQVICVSIHTDSDILAESQGIKDALSNSFHRIGLIVKVSETWHSDKLVAYGRKYYYDGQPLPQGCKTCLRFAAGDNEGSDSVTMMTMTAMSAGTALSGGMSDPAIGAFLSLVEWYLNLLGTPRWKCLLTDGDTPLITLSWMTASLGYLPVQPLPFFQYAGHRDMLSESLTMLDKIMKKFPGYSPYISSALYLKPRRVDAESNLQLVLDPFSPNLEGPITAESYIKDQVKEYLTNSSTVVNKRIKAVFKYLNVKPQIDLSATLLQIQPLNTSIAHALFDYSTVGHIMSLVNKFIKISSVVRMTDANLITDEKLTFTEMIRLKDSAFLNKIKKQLTPSSRVMHSVPKALHNEHWGQYESWCNKHSHLTTCVFSARLYWMVWTHGLGDGYLYGPYSPGPAEQIRYLPNFYNAPKDRCILVSPASYIPSTLAELETKRGPFALYIGTATNEPVKPLKFVNLSGVASGVAVTMLTKIYAWVVKVGSSKNIMELMGRLVDSRLHGLAKLLHQALPTVAGGDLLHRLGLPGESNGAYLASRSMSSTWYNMSTNQATLLQDGSVDRYIFYQQLFHHIQTILRWHTPKKSRMAFEVRVDCCGYEIPDFSFDCPSNLLLPSVEGITPSMVSDDIADLVRQDFMHQVWVKDLGMSKVYSAEHGLAAAMGSMVADSLMKYQLGTTDTEVTGSRMSCGGLKLNLTLVRAVDTEMLCRSIGLAWAYRGSLGDMLSPHELLNKLRFMVGSPTAIQELLAYKSLLESFITAGKLGDLISLAGMGTKWSTKDASHSNLLIFLNAVMKSVENMIHFRLATGLLIEVDQRKGAIRRLGKFMRMWSKAYRRWSVQNSSHDVMAFLRHAQTTHEMVKVHVYTSVDQLIADARNATDALVPAPLIKGKALARLPDPKSVEFHNCPPWAQWGVSEPSLPTEDRLRLQILNMGFSGFYPLPDNAFQITRWANTSSAGGDKLMEVINRTTIKPPDRPDFVTLAEGGGSMLSRCLHLHPRGIALYNSLVPPEGLSPAAIDKHIPPEIQCVCKVENRVKNVPYFPADSGDLRYENTWLDLERDAREHRLRNVMVTFDMEAIGEPDPTVYERLAIFCKRVDAKWAMVKLYGHVGFKSLTRFFERMEQIFPCMEGVKPMTSNPCSREYYVVWGHGSGNGRSENWSSLLEWSLRVGSQAGTISEQTFLRRVEGVSDWLRHFEPCMMRDTFTLEPYKSGEGGVVDGLVLISYQLRHLLGSHDLAMTGVARSTQSMTNADTKGTQSTLDNIWSILAVWGCVDQALGFGGPGLTKTEAIELLIKGKVRLLKEVANLESHFTLQPQRDLMWRRLGQLLLDSNHIPPQFARELCHQYLHVVDKVKNKKHLGAGLKGLPEAVIEMWRIQHVNRLGVDQGIFSAQGGLEWCSRQLMDVKRIFGEFIREQFIQPIWLEKSWNSFQWPVSKQKWGNWDLVIVKTELVDSVERDMRPPAVLLTWISEEDDFPRLSGWNLVRHDDMGGITFLRYHNVRR